MTRHRDRRLAMVVAMVVVMVLWWCCGGVLRNPACSYAEGIKESIKKEVLVKLKKHTMTIKCR